jgi:hypothetical protein
MENEALSITPERLKRKRQINPPWIRSSEIPFALYGSREFFGCLAWSA